MSSLSLVFHEFSNLPPIKTKAKQNNDEGCTTPRSDGCLLKPQLTCPPAPKKPRAAKRKAKDSGSTVLFCDVPRDLTSVFVKVGEKSASVVEKRIRIS